jgi:hypothetical protein
MTLRAMQFRLGYDLLPVLESSAPANKNLNILVASTALGEDDALQLARVQYAKWFCEDMADHIALSITLHVPENAMTVRAVFDDLGVEYDVIGDLDENNLEAVAETAVGLDCDLVISTGGNPLRVLFTDEYGIVSPDVAAALHAAEIHLKGFDMPWSFEWPGKNMPWSQFYPMSEHSIFRPLLEEFSASHAAGPQVYDVMRKLVADAVPALCFGRDRLEFYRQQDRWAQRNRLEHQDFGFEYAAFLNHFYLTFYSAVDQVTGLVVNRFNLPVPEREIGATYKAFRESRKAYPAVEHAFDNPDFWDMYNLPQSIRHRAAHSGPVRPEDVYFGDGEFTDEQLDAAAEENGLMDNVRFFQARETPEALIANALMIAREKARRILMGPPRRHGVYLKTGKKKAVFYYPDPAVDLNKFLTFFKNVITLCKPWNEVKSPALINQTEERA